MGLLCTTLASLFNILGNIHVIDQIFPQLVLLTLVSLLPTQNDAFSHILVLMAEVAGHCLFLGCTLRRETIMQRVFVTHFLPTCSIEDRMRNA